MAARAPFEDVITGAVANAVRRAVDELGRTGAPALASGDEPPRSPVPRRRDRPRPPADDLDPYAMVGVDVAAPWDELAASYRLRAKAWHPDAPDTPDPSGELLRRLNVAYEELRIRRGKRPLDGVLQPTPVPRKREPAEEEPVDLGAPEHAWWAASPIDPYHRAEQPPEPEAQAQSEPEAPSSEVVPDDPYEVLRVRPSATWEEIVASYRKLARWYHPDGLVDPSPADRATCEEMIRRFNAAYAELRVRRGR